MNKKIIFRIVTSNYCIETHLLNTLKRVPNDYFLYVLGDNVSKYNSIFNNVFFIDVPIKRNFSIFYDIYAIFKLSFLLIKYKPLIIHSLMMKAGLFSAILGKMFKTEYRIHTFTGQIWQNETFINKLFLKFIDIIINNLNTVCLTDSLSQSNFLYSENIRTKNNKKLPYLLNGSISGIDFDLFDLEKVNKYKKELLYSLNIHNDDFIIGYIARKSVDKGVLDMLFIFKEVLKINNNLKLLFIGPDESNGLVDKFLLEHSDINDKIISLNFVTNHHEYLSLCKILCLPSYREGFGSIVIDAAALNIPTIGYDIYGLTDSINTKYNGKLIPVGNKEIFISELNYLIKNKEVLNALSKNCRNYALEFYDSKLINRELYKFYEKLRWIKY